MMDNVQMIRGQAAQIQMEKKKLPTESRLSSPLVSAFPGGWLLAVAPVLQSWWGLTQSHTQGMPAPQDPSARSVLRSRQQHGQKRAAIPQRLLTPSLVPLLVPGSPRAERKRSAGRMEEGQPEWVQGCELKEILTTTSQLECG